MNKKKAIVFGGAGFIGSFISEKLLEHGVKVTVFDNFSRGRSSNLKNIEDQIQVVKGDIRDMQCVKEVMNGEQYNYVFIEAALWFTDCEECPYEGMNNNFTGTHNIVECCRQTGVEKVIFASSASLYGNSQPIPFIESNELKDMSFYSTSKIACEHLLKSYHKKYGLKYVILRYMNVFGPRQDYRRSFTGVVMKTIKLVSEGKAPCINGDGSQTLDLTYVEDIANANVLAALDDNVVGTFNVSTNRETSVKQLITYIVNRIDGSIIPEYKNVSGDLVGRKVASYKLAEKTFGYVPTVSVEEGLDKAIEWYRNEMKGGDI